MQDGKVKDQREMYHVNCALMLSVCNMWQFRHYLFFSFLFFFVFIVFIFFLVSSNYNLVNKVD